MSMNRAFSAVAGSLALVAIQAGAFAQGRTPEGSYRASCESIRVVGNDLHADCRADGGGPFVARKPAVLRDFRSCRGDIWQFRGQLSCQRTAAAGPPAGSYRAICRDSRAQGADLYSTCRLPDGSYRRVVMRNFASCDGDIAMISGRFRCNRL